MYSVSNTAMKTVFLMVIVCLEIYDDYRTVCVKWLAKL
jgi:hypothetical protein